MEDKKIKLRNVSMGLSILFKILMIAYPAIFIAFWFGWINPSSEYLTSIRLPVDVDLSTVRPALRLYAGIFHFIPIIFILFSFYYLIKLFELYSQNIIFSLQNVYYIRKIGFMLLFEAIANIVIQPFLSIILTYDAAPGGHMIGIGFGNNDLSNWVIALVVIIASWIMEEGRKLEEDQALTV